MTYELGLTPEEITRELTVQVKRLNENRTLWDKCIGAQYEPQFNFGYYEEARVLRSTRSSRKNKKNDLIVAEIVVDLDRMSVWGFVKDNYGNVGKLRPYFHNFIHQHPDLRMGVFSSSASLI